MAGTATTIPPAVLYKATEIPLAKIATSWPLDVNELNNSTIPTIVPNKPNKGATVEIVPSALIFVSNLWATSPALS